MGDLIQLIVSGTATGAIYALAALGFTLLWQAAGVINFAQGEFVMLPSFAMLFGIALGMPLWLAFLFACVLAAVVLGAGFKFGIANAQKDLRYALAYARFKGGAFDEAERHLQALRRPELFRKATELRALMQDCRDTPLSCG